MTIAEILAQGMDNLAPSLSDPREVIAIVAAVVASALIIISTIVKTIVPLRWLAVGGNLGFVVYGISHPAPMVLLLHAALLPINLYRAVEMVRLTRRVVAAAASREHSAVWLKPYMKPKRLRAGNILFRKGDPADHLYFLAEGTMEIVELGTTLQPGGLFGEIAFFAPDRQRTGTARCVTACKVLRIDETTFKQLYYQNPEFGFEVVKLIAARLSGDVRRLEQQLAHPPGAVTPPRDPARSAPATTDAPAPRPGPGIAPTPQRPP